MKPHYRTIFIALCTIIMAWPIQLAAVTFDSASNAHERRDYSSAIRQFTELARQNDPYAQYMLGKIYATGDGARKDYLSAYKWLHLAENRGIDAAGNLKRKISKKMSRQEIAEANTLIQEWQETYTSANQPVEIIDPIVVRKVQQELANRGYYFDMIDGLIGSKTRYAIRRFQQSKGTTEDGRITSALLDDLHLSRFIPQSPSIPHEKVVTAEGELTVLQKKLRKIIRKAKKTTGRRTMGYRKA